MATPTFSSQTVAKVVADIPVGMGLQVSFQLVGVLVGDIAMLVPIGFDPRVHIKYALAVVDSSLQVTFEFTHTSLTPMSMPSSYKFAIMSGF
jgi:hypothetical protein